ncbi:putative uncharacterized protein LOC400499 [Collichthys lucidus]|uniref:VWFD domain-containing protein n=1 Tax=Collichthys lucidus TaxID=240159 RepID=A0A4V6AT58_COLLU|nr:putative uncharacterized protein LOC400499 [Collichthys lucidus]
MLGHSAPLELRLAAIQAFRRFPCSADRSVLLQLYRSSQEDPEVRIAAYQQLMRCPDQDVFEVVKTTLRSETSSQVGSYVWSHLTNVLRSEDPMKQSLIESLPDDIISRDFEAEFLKYSSYSDYTVSSGMGITNVETSLVFSPKSFLPRSATANLTLYFHGRAHNLLEVDLHVENAEPLLKNVFGHQTHDSDAESAAQSRKHVQSKEVKRTRRKIDDSHRGEREMCLSTTNSYLDQARAMLFGKRPTDENRPKCWVGVKVFGNELSVFTCDDLYSQINQLSLSVAGLAVKLLKGHEVHLNHRAVLMTEELVLPSLSGLPVKLGINMTSLLSLRLKGNVNYRDTSHFSLTGYIKPNAHVALSARMGVDGALGQAAVDWVSDLSSSTSLDGSIQLQEGRDLRVTLNTPEDVMDIISVSSRVFQLSGDHREEIKGPKSRVQKTTCTPKTWSKMVGWQLCSNASYPLHAIGISLPPPGPAHLSLRLLKLDRGLHYYLLEAAYSMLAQRGTWLPREASIHFLLATPQSSISRDMSLDLTFNPHRLLLRITHPLKTIHIQGQLEQERNIKSGKLELLIDGVHYYIMGLVDTHNLLSEQRTRYHLEAKMAADGHPMILSANVTRGLGRKTSFSATVKNVFRETASLSVSLERRRDGSSRQYSVDAELLLPGVVGSKMLGLMEQKGSLWSSALRLKYGLGGDARHLRQECYMSQRLRSERDSNLTYIMRADHEFYCSSIAPINHKFNLQVPENNLNYRTQLLHSHLRQLGSESSTHLKINYNNLMPLVVGLHWKSPPKDTLQKKWEGTFNMDTPWLYIYTAHKLNQHQHHTLQLTSELTASKWLTIRNLLLEGFYRDRDREKEARLKLYTPAVTYIQTGGWGVAGKRSVKASASFSSLWTPPLRGDISLEASKFSHTLQMASTYGKHNVSLTAALNTVDKRQAMLKMTFSKLKSPSTELEFQGVIEELRRDKKMYQKTAMLQLRQPFQTFPQSLLLRETFTVDLLKGLYILESKAGFHGNREVIHTLTLGYKPPSPFTQKDMQGRLRIGSKERLTFFGQVQLNPLHSSHQAIKVRANFSHQLELQLPSSAIAEGNVYWDPKNNTDFDYQAKGMLRVERQECKVKATADISTVAGRGSSSVHVRADGKDRVKLDAQMSHILQRGERAVTLTVNVSQSLLPSATDLHVNMAANMSSHSVSLHGSYKQGHEAVLAQVKGSLINTPGPQLAVSGDLRHSMASLAILPPVLGLDGAIEWSDMLIEGQMRVRVMETVYRVELKHQEDPGDSLESEDEEGMMGKKFHVAHDWLCVWVDAEHSCVNVSRQLGDWGTGEVHTGLFHSFQLLRATGVPASSSAQVRWAQDGGRLSVLVDLQAGPQQLKAEFNGGKTDQVIPRWEYVSRLQHQVKALLKRGVPSSIQAKAHYQMNCTGDATADRLSAQCYGNVAGRPVEVRVFRSYRPHNRLCYGLSLVHFSLSAQAKGCYSSVGQKELRADLTHTSVPLLTHLGVPTKSSLRLLLRPGPQRWALGFGLVAGPWRTDLIVRLRLERPGLYGWHGMLEFGTRGVTHKAEMTGRMRVESWCNIWADVSAAWDSITSSLLVSVRCNGVGRLVWVQVRRAEGVVPHKTSLTVHGQAWKDGLKGSLALENEPDSLQCLLLIVLKDQKAEVGWTFQHQWAYLASIMPKKVDLQASGQLSDTFLSGSAQVSFKAHSAQINMTTTWEPSTSMRVMLQQNLATTGVPGELTISMLTTASQAELEVESDVCSMLLLANQRWGREDRRTSWNFFVYQRCAVLKGTVLPVSLALQGLLSVVPCQLTMTSSLRADNQDLSLDLSQSCRPPHLSGTFTHSFLGLRSHGVPQMITVEANAPGGPEQAGVLFITAGTCYIRANRFIEAKGRTQWLWTLESKCPVLQGHFNGSVWKDPQDTWTATMDTDLEGKKGFLRLSARAWPELCVDGELVHNLPALKNVPQHSRLRVTSKAGKQRYDTEALVQMEQCTVRASAVVMSQRGLQGSLVYHNNCTVIQVELGSAGGKTLTLQSQFGGQQAGVRLKMKCLPMTKEIRGAMWHSWLWLQDKGLPRNIEGVYSQLQSRAQLTVDRHKLLASGLNVSVADGRLALMLSYSPLVSNQTGMWPSLDTSLTAQFKGPLRSASIDIHSHDRRLQVVGDVGGWGARGGSKEARVTLKHTVQGQTSPALQVEAWGRLTESQLRCSVAVNPELSSSLALILQGHHLPHSKDLMVKVVQNIPRMLVYLPSQLNVRSQLNQSQSSVAGLVEVLSGKRRLWALGELAAIESGYRQAVELKHSYPQLKPLPRTVAARTVCEARNWSYQVQHEAVWGNQEFSLSGLYSAPPALEMGNQTLKVKINCVPRWTNLEATMERALQRRLDSVLLSWTRHGRLEQVRALSSWSRSEEMNETKLELKHPFSSTLSQMSLHTLSQTSQSEQRSSQQTHLSWDSSVPVNISLNLNKQWQNNSSRGQACALFSTQQRGQGLHSLQLNVGLDKVSPAPCPSHSLLTKIQTNLRDRLEHTVLLSFCPPQPTLSWSGSHRVNSGEELFYTQSRLSVTGRPHQCSLTFALTNSSTPQGSNMSLFSEVEARLDHKEKIWLNGTVEGRCLQTTAGYIKGPGLSEDITVVGCVGKNRSLMLDVQKRDGSSKPETLAGVSVGSTSHRLTLRASGCLESLTTTESRDSELLQELSAVPLHVSQQAEALLGHGDGGLLALWLSGPLRRIVTDSIPRFLSLLQHASLLGQQELRRPLATLAGVYQDVKGQRPEALWRETVSLWLTGGLVEVIPSLLGNPQLRPLAQAGVATLSIALDAAGQHTYQWVETRLAMALSGVRKRLASVYKFSPSECSVIVSVPLPPLPSSKVVKAGLVEILLEEWVLRPLQTLASFRPIAELYRLKRKIMDSPFRHEALLVADQFVVTFDGHLYELPSSCPLLLAQDIRSDPSFTLLLTSDSHNFLLVEMNNSTVNIQHNGQVKANCNNAATHTFYSNNGVSVKSGSNIVQVSSQNGASVSCNLLLEVCSFTLDGWLHGTSTGLLGTNDYEAGNDSPVPDGSQAENQDSFFHSWQMKPECIKPPGVTQHFPKAAMSPVSCDFLFSSPDSPLSSCFRVVDPAQFLSVCELTSSRGPCRLASAFAHLCQQNYIPLEVPAQCCKLDHRTKMCIH